MACIPVVKKTNVSFARVPPPGWLRSASEGALSQPAEQSSAI